VASIIATRPAQKRADDYFFIAMALLALVMVFIGFARTYYLAGMLRAKLPSPIVHVHGVLFSCWILLFIAQIALVSANRVDLHKRLGVLGIGVAALMVPMGFAVLVDAVRRHAVFGMGLDALFGQDVLQLSAFAALAFFGLRARRNGPAHKRLMTFATVALMGPAVSRWPFAFAFSSVFVFFGIIDVFLVAMIAFDLWSRRKIHPATIGGSLVILFMQIILIPVGHLPFWHQVTTWIQHF